MRIYLGDVKAALERLNIKKSESSQYHPQSQGKIERSHGTWKTKLRYDLEKEKGTDSFYIQTIYFMGKNSTISFLRITILIM